MKLPSAHRPDSQGICFLGKINYTDFIKKYVGEQPGEIIELESEKLLGEHKGISSYTIGQRRGLRLGGGPWLWCKKTSPKTLCMYPMAMIPSPNMMIRFAWMSFIF